MKDSLNKVRETLRKKHTQKILTRLVSIFSAFLVFITTYALILPAITLELNATCGIEEHQHGDECYEERLICGQEESDGHHHDDSCYEVSRELVCEIPEHQHSADNGCFDADGNLICELSEHVHIDSCYREVKTLVCGMEESDGHHHTDACYEKVLVCGKEVHTHSEACYKNEGSEESEDAASSAQSDTEQVELTSETQSAETDETAAAAEEAVYAEPYIPELDPLNMEAVLTKNTDFYYFHAEEGEEIPADSAFIYDWRPVEKDTELASTDLVKMYLAYSIPAGSLNETNPTARYRLPENIHLTDDQIDAINKNENGITAGFSESDPEYRRYLGAEAVEGDRAPDELLQDGALEYISAVVRAENVYEDGSYLGQDLIFTFIPYTIEKNQTTYDAEQNPLSAGETVTGWFACDFNLDQIDWEEEETIQEVIPEEDESDLADASDSDIDPENETGEEETGQDAAPEDEDELTKDESAEDVLAEDLPAEESVQAAEEGETAETLPAVKKAEKTIIKTADVIFAEKNERENIKEIRRSLKQVEKTIIDLPAEDSQEDTQEEEVQEFKSGTLTAEGDGYRIRLDYTEDAKIPEGAALSVREITAETDEEAHESCLEQAREHVSESGDERTEIDTQASRFFDIEIIVTEEDGTSRKIEPAAPVSVNIQIEDAPADSSDSADASKEAQNTDPTVLHFAEDGVEQIESASDSGQKDDAASEGGETTEISFEAESFSIYGVVYTVDFEYSVNGKMYQFSLPGGGFVSFTDLVEVLGIVGNTNTDEDGDEIDTSEAQDANGMLDVKASYAAKRFVTDVASVEFSSPELVDISKVEADTTVGQIKESRELECEYSAELTKEQIAEINAQKVEAGDWALISVQPFTSEESMTVTMKNGETFKIRVTDAQITKDYLTASGKTYTITITYNDDAEIPDDADLEVEEILESSQEYKEYLKDSAEELDIKKDEISFARFFDIKIVKDGEKVEPKSPVQVKIEYKDAMEFDAKGSLNVVHFADLDTEVISEVSLSADNKEVVYEQASFSVTGTIISEPPQGRENKYMVLVNYPNGSDNYYMVNNDGSLTKVNYNADGTVDVEYPMLWTVDGRNPDRHIYFNTEATGFNYQDTAADYFRRYLDPNAASGITEEDKNNITLGRRPNDNVKTGYVVTNRDNILSQTSVNNYNDNGVQKVYHGTYRDHSSLGVELDSSGNPVHVSGKNDWSEAVNVVFAEPRSVPGVGTSNHTVDHIDIAISGKSEITVPLAYGTYYYKDENGNWKEYVVTTSKSLDLEQDKVRITPEDMKGATIKAYNPKGEELNNAFVVEGYSSNASNAYSDIQVRIGGRFKVADTYYGGGNDADTKKRRLDNKITYSVSAIKELTFDLKDDEHGQLYEKLPDGTYQKMSVTVDVNMSASFDYWDDRNECPGIKNEIIWGSHDAWVNGGIPEHGLSGMDFVLGGDAEEAGSKIVATEITKMIVDENGHRIKPSIDTHIVNSFDLYQNKNGNPNSVVGLDINKYNIPANYDGYTKVHTKDIKVGPDGMGLVYDYDVTPGMFYIQEDKDSIVDSFKDADGETWHYVGTRIETEYPWRDQPNYNKDDVHVSETYTKDGGKDYNSIPDVLGPYTDINGKDTYYNQETGKNEILRNGFLEFFVYNIYEPEKAEVKVEKEWENGTAPEGASVDVVLKRYKLVPNGSITPPEPTTADLTINDSYSGLSGDRHYSASYHVTGPEGFDHTYQWTGEPIVIPDVDFGQYSVTKTAVAQEGYDADNLNEEQTVTVGVSGGGVTFAGTTYTRQNTSAQYYHVLVFSSDTLNQGTEHIADNGHYAWVDTDYPAGTVLNFTVGVPAWNNNSTYSYSINYGSPVTIPKGQTMSQEITVDRDITIVINGTTPYYSQWLNPVPSVSVKSTPNRTLRTMAKRGSLRAASAYVLSNSGGNPELEGYTWQEDTTWYDGEGLTVHLPDAGSWAKTIGDLEKEDPYGNVYVYYIDSVTENGMPSGMTAQITLDGDNKLFVYGDHADEGSTHTNDTLKVKNILATGTTITVQKVICGTTTPLPGAEFTIRKYTDAEHRNEIEDDEFPIVQTVNANGQIILEDLKVGYYKLEESDTPEGYIKTSADPYFEVRQNSTTKDIEVVFANTDMVTYADSIFTVENEPGAVLPSTGGPGTRLFTILGSILILGAGILLWRRRRLI